MIKEAWKTLADMGETLWYGMVFYLLIFFNPWSSQQLSEAGNTTSTPS